MAQALILTEDERLYHLVSLLCSECRIDVGDTAPSLLITDKAEIPPHLRPLPCLKIGEGGLSRPFLHDDFKERLTSLLAEDAPPLLTPTEKRLFDALRSASPATVSREVLSSIAFGDENEDGRLNLYIHYLRNKIELDGKKRIFAKRGKGYYYVNHPTR